MTGSVIGEPTDEFVTNQVKIRQQTYAKGLGNSNRTPQDIQFMNNRNAWIKMASSVSIEEDFRVPKDTGTPSNFRGSNLAKNAILFNGLSLFDGNKLNMRAGVNVGAQAILPSTSYFNNSAYGLGGNEFGILPMPGINSVSIDSKNRGSIKTATIQIIAFNRYQFDIIETLYCRLGFSMIVEWGWDKYIDNKGVYQTVKSTVLEEKFFSSMNQENIIKEINKTSKKYNGNTGGLFGKVVNFTWKYNADGSYNITVKMTGLGDVIESMKINQSPSLALKESLGNLSAVRYGLLKDAKSSIHTNKTVTKLGTILFKTLDDETLWRNGGNGSYFNLYQALQNSSYSSFLDGNNTGGIKIEYNYFIRFGELLSVIQKHITPDINGTSTGIKFVKFDTKVNTVICSVQPNLISFDPAVCMIKMDDNKNLNQNDITGIETPDYTSTMEPFTVIKGSNASTSSPLIFNLVFKDTTQGPLSPNQSRYLRVQSSTQFNRTNYTYKDANDTEIPVDRKYNLESQTSIPGSGTQVAGNLMYGQILNIYLNYDMIFNTLSKNVDKKGNLTFFKFLQSMCDNINSAFANVLDIEPIIKDDKTITFMDTKPIQGLGNKLSSVLPGVSSDTARFEVNNFNNDLNGAPTEATFLKNISFNTKFSPKLASQLSIGATAGGVALGQDATGLSKWNSGLQDRFQKTIEDPDIVIASTNTGNNTNPGTSTPPTNPVSYTGDNEYLAVLLQKQNTQQPLQVDGNLFPLKVTLSVKLDQEVYLDNNNRVAKRQGSVPIEIEVDKNGLIVDGGQIPTPGNNINTQNRIPYRQDTYNTRQVNSYTSNNWVSNQLPTNEDGSRNANRVWSTWTNAAAGDVNNNNLSSPQYSTSYFYFDIEVDGMSNEKISTNNEAEPFLNKQINGLYYYEAITQDIIKALAKVYGVENNVDFSNPDYNGGGRTDLGSAGINNNKFVVPAYNVTPTTGAGATAQIARRTRQLAGANYSAYLAQMFGGSPTVPVAIQQQLNINAINVSKKDSEYTFRPNQDSYAKAGKSSYKIYLDEANKKAQLASPSQIEPSNQIGLLPIEFDMEMEGIAGFRIYNKIKINQDFLPSNYANSLKFLVKGINHKIDGSGWTTNLQTLSTSNLNARPVQTNARAVQQTSTTSRPGTNSWNISINPNVDQNIIVLANTLNTVDDGKNNQRIPLKDRVASAHFVQEVKNAEGFVGRAYDDKKPSAILVASDVVNNNGSGNLRSRTGNPNNRGTLTIGYGFTRNVNDLSPLRSLEWDSTITQTQADDILDRAMRVQYHNLLKTPPRGAQSIADVPVTQGEYDALLSIAYNGGSIGNKSNSLDTPLNKALLNRQYTAAGEILKKYRITQNRRYLQGLVNRRQAEYNLFIS